MTNRKHHHAVIWLLATALLGLLTAVAQEGNAKNPKKKIGSVVVEVKDRQSQEPVTGAIVFLTVDGSDYPRSPESDDEGKAEFTDVPHGQATVQATKDGWKTAGVTITLDGKTRKISLQMEKK